MICGDRDTGRALVAHPTPQLVAITGSVRAGMEVASAASSDLKRVHLELGGKAPVIIFDDADIALAAETIAVGGYFNAGQDCTAATRVIASPKIYSDIVDALAEQARNTKTGQPDDEDVLFGPLNNPSQYERVAAMVDAAPGHAHLAAGGHRLAGPGFFYEPTVISDLRQDDEMIQNEIFGPVITVQPFSDEDEAVTLGQRRAVRPGFVRLDQNHGRAMRCRQRARLRLRLDQHPHPARRRDAARRLQALRLRQGPVHVRARGLHAHQARDEQSRRLTSRRTVAVNA